MPHVDNHQVESPETSVTSRRRLLSALVAGGAFATAAPLLASRASAADSGSSSPSRDPQDNNALNNALAREARMVGTYRLAAAAVSADDEVAGLTLILDHHIAYVHAIKGYLGPDAKDAPETPLSSPSGSLKAMAAGLAQIEDDTATIHTDILAILSGMDAAKILASIIIVEARHSAALNMISGTSPLVASGN
jgi:hypothetical protein